MVSKEGLRVALWMCFTTNIIITTVYWLLNLFVFYKLVQASSQVDWADANNVNSTEIVGRIIKNAPPAIWRSPMAATILGALLVLGFNLFSCIILLKKSINRSGPGFGYGFIVAFSFTLSVFCLLCGIILHGFQNVVQDQLQGYTSWSSGSTQAYYGAEAFAFITFAELFLFFLALMIFQGAVSDQLGITKDLQSSAYNTLEGTPIMMTPQHIPGGPGNYSDRAAAVGGNGYAEQYNNYNNTAYNNGAVASSGYSQTEGRPIQQGQYLPSQGQMPQGGYAEAGADAYAGNEYDAQQGAQLGGFQGGYGGTQYAGNAQYGGGYGGQGPPAQGGFYAGEQARL